jgi:hypothetical protein
VELDTLQNLFYADKRYKLLVVLQGTDTSGKDGTRMRGEGPFADLIAMRFAKAYKRIGYGRLPPLDSSKFLPPLPQKSESPQGALF